MSAAAGIVLMGLGAATVALSVRRSRAAVRLRASVDRARCRRCLLCLDACGHDALTAVGGHVAVDPSRCEGCGRCAERCRRGAISLVAVAAASGPRAP